MLLDSLEYVRRTWHILSDACTYTIIYWRSLKLCVCSTFEDGIEEEQVEGAAEGRLLHQTCKALGAEFTEFVWDIARSIEILSNLAISCEQSEG